MKLFLACLLFSVFQLHEAAGQEREVVVWVQETTNTVKYIKALQTSIARFFNAYAGRGNKFSFTVYRMSSEDQLEMVLEKNKEPDEVTGVFGTMLANPLPVQLPCPDLCCAGAGLKTYFSQIITKHQGSILLVVVDELPYFSEQEKLQLASDIRKAGVMVLFVRAATSYCMNGGLEELLHFGVTEYLLLLDIFDMILMQYNNKFLGYEGGQGITIFLKKTKLTKPLEIIDPNGTPRDYVIHFQDNENGFALISVFGGCEAGWTMKDGQCYLLRPEPSTWVRADEDCRRYNATLLSAVEGRLPQALLDDDKLWAQDAGLEVPETSWLTLRDDNAAREYYWKLFAKEISLRNANVTNWAAGEPSSGIPSGSRCVRIDRNSQWKTSVCFSLLPYLCTKPAQSVPNGNWQVKMDSLIGCTLYDFQFY